jgi:hypothetical protein
LLGIDLVRSERFHAAIDGGSDGIKPGWVRVNFNYFISEAVFGFIIAAIDFIAREGWRFLPDYTFDAVTGVWRHRQVRASEPLSLDQINYCGGRMVYRSLHRTEPESAFDGYLEQARRLATRPPASADSGGWPSALPPELESLRWFPLPGELS